MSKPQKMTRREPKCSAASPADRVTRAGWASRGATERDGQLQPHRARARVAGANGQIGGVESGAGGARLVRRRIPHRRLAVQRRGHECAVDTTPHAVGVRRPELVGEHKIVHAAVHLACDGEFAQLDNGAVDGN